MLFMGIPRANTRLWSFLAVAATLIGGAAPLAVAQPVTFAAFGDFGSVNQTVQDVTALVNSWNPEFIISLGDHNYGNSSLGHPDWDLRVGQVYGSYIKGRTAGLDPYPLQTSATQQFYPTVGNKAVSGGTIAGYVDYFHTDPGDPTGRLPAGVHNDDNSYYDVQLGRIHLFLADSENAISSTVSKAAQMAWLEQALAASTATWKFVFFHHSPYSSGGAGSYTDMQWPFHEWGADAIFSAHSHMYERLIQNELPYFISGLGGHGIHSANTPISGSQTLYRDDYGAMRVTVAGATATFQFVSLENSETIIDTYAVNKMLTPEPETHFWTAVVDSGAWGDGNNWDAGGASPELHWDAVLENTLLASGQRTVVDGDSAVNSVTVQGTVGPMTLEVESGITLTATDGVLVNNLGVLDGSGLVTGNVLVNGGTVSPGSDALLVAVPELGGVPLFVLGGMLLMGIRRRCRQWPVGPRTSNGVG